MTQQATEPTSFPHSFVLGATLVGHQVEGRNYQSDWWAWEQRPGRIAGDDTSAEAAGHYDRFAEDIALAARFGHRALLFSVEWSRVEPEPGRFSDDALRHYRSVLRALRDEGLEAFCVLNHVTLPKWFADTGGWARNDAPERFAAFVGRVLPEWQDLCRWWIPIAEPMHLVSMAYLDGLWPPGRVCPPWMPGPRRVFSHLMAAHAAACRLIKQARRDAQVGTLIRARRFIPRDPDSAWDLRTARDEQDRCTHAVAQALTDGRLPGRSRIIDDLRGTADFIGVAVDGVETIAYSLARPLGMVRGQPPAPPPIAPRPEALAEVLQELAAYHLPLFVMGAGTGTGDDAVRCRSLLDHLWHTHRAMQAGADVRGYFHRTLLDGFEWRRGYSTRYGLFHVDRTTLARTPNPSAWLFKDICESGALRPGAVTRYCPGWKPPEEES